MENHIFRISEEKRKEIISLYVDDCYRKSKVAAKSGISRPTVDHVLRGLDRGTRYFIGKEDDEKIVGLYALNLTVGKTAKLTRYTKDTVTNVLLRNNVPAHVGRKWKYLCGGSSDGWIKMRPDEFAFRIKKQNSKCAICGKDFLYTTPCADHKHGTQTIRGFLCKSCNTKLAGVEDTEFMTKAIDYLRRTNPP
jgi:hypothetical protein